MNPSIQLHVHELTVVQDALVSLGILADPPFMITSSWSLICTLYLSGMVVSFCINSSISLPSFLFASRRVGCDSISASFAMRIA